MIRRNWTDAEINYLKDNLHKTITELAEDLERGYTSVKAKITRLGEHRAYNCIVCNKELTQKGRYCTPHNWIERKITSSKYRAIKKERFGYSLPEQEAIEILQKPCAYCGDTETNSGLDRVDSSKGYESGNVVPCCPTCNQMKSNMELDVWMAHMKRILEKHNG